MTSNIEVLNTPGEIVKNLIFLHDINNVTLAEAIGVHASTIGRLVEGYTKNPKDKLLRPIADYFSLTLDQLKGLNPIPWNTIKESIFGNTRRLPVYSWIKADEWVQEISDSGTLKTVITDKELPDDAFTMEVKDSSMEPLFPKGTKIVCNPHKEIRDRAYILVRQKNIEAVIFRQVLIDGEYKFLKPLNKDLPSHQMRVMEDEYEYIGTIVESKIEF